MSSKTKGDGAIITFISVNLLRNSGRATDRTTWHVDAWEGFIVGLGQSDEILWPKLRFKHAILPMYAITACLHRGGMLPMIIPPRSAASASCWTFVKVEDAIDRDSKLKIDHLGFPIKKRERGIFGSHLFHPMLISV